MHMPCPSKLYEYYTLSTKLLTSTLIFRSFCLEDMCETECLKSFRFKKDDLNRLKTALRLPDILQTASGKIEGLEGMFY